MPRKPRIDHPGLLHHIIARGIERRRIFQKQRDYKEFTSRLEQAKGDSQIFAWVLMPNHIHLLIKTGNKRLWRIMSQLLTGYAGYFNRKYKRAGHLFQNRYKSIVCDEGSYFSTLIRYIHLNPFRAGMVKDLKGLAAYPWCGHGVVIGKRSNSWQEVEGVFEHYGHDRASSLRAYLEHVREGMVERVEDDLDGGGLIRSSCGQNSVLRNSRAGGLSEFDDRVLGDGEFVRSVMGNTEQGKVPSGQSNKQRKLHSQFEKVCDRFGVRMRDIQGNSRNARVSKAREACVQMGVTQFGMTGSELAKLLNKTEGAISQAYYRALKWIRQDPIWQIINN